MIASTKVIARLMEEQSQDLAELEELVKRPIRLQSESLYLQEGFDVVPI